MQLWNDYEGKTIAEAYPLTKLLRPEGRSAFFVTAEADGTPEVIRITESLNDEHEMLERWRQVSDVNQANLIEIKKFGYTTVDGVPLTYALMESSDGSLGDILKERPLTASETREVATSIAAALTALHASSLIHEHVEPANVLATGEVIKLRSDCVRECIPDPEFNPPALCAELKQRDVHDLAMLLLRCLTLEKKFTTKQKLPSPFDQIVPRGIDGSWGLAEITSALAMPVITPGRTLVPENVLSQGRSPSPAASARPATSSSAPTSAASQLDVHSSSPTLHVRRVETPIAARPQLSPRWIAIAAGSVLLLLLLWHFVGGKPTQPVITPVASNPTQAAPRQAIPAAPSPVREPATQAQVQPAPAPAAPLASTARGWRVVTYTYNHEDQAWKKAASLLKQHPTLHPEVFSPSGHAPFLVTLGGVMSQSQAEAMRKQARRAGLPRDTFARLYQAR